MMWNDARLAPTHVVLQRLFNLAPPSVNSVPIRLERRGIARSASHQTRAIELTTEPHLNPPLDCPFKV